MQYCTDDLGLFNEDSHDYGFGWSKYNESYVPPNGFDAIYNSFQHQDALQTNDVPLKGQFNTYAPSGYLYELRGSLNFLKGNLSLLRDMNWIDRQTRAVIIEFSVYNPNINLIMVATILVEFLPSGTILTLARFDLLNLFSEVGKNAGIKIACDLIFMAFIVGIMVNEIRKIINTGFRKYICEFWSYIQWAMVICAWTAFVIFIYRLNKAYEVMDFFSNTKGYGYINLQVMRHILLMRKNILF